MTFLLGVDTGGTYTDAAILNEATDTIVASAKSLTTRPDLALGVGQAIDAAIAQADVAVSEIAMVSLSTTLATNALVEGQGGRIALVFIGFDPAELTRAGLAEALRGDPVIQLAGGHSHAGTEVAPLDIAALMQAISVLGSGVTGFAVAGSFATRNPAHEIAVRDILREMTGKPVTCSHELSQALGGPKRALTAVLNARLIGMIARLIDACEGHLRQIGVNARLMVVRGDGALVSAAMAREKPIETILSGPAASIAGASWLTGERDALVSDIGGTTTDICLLRDGRPKIDPDGAQVGPYRTMVEAVAMRTWGLGGDSEVHVLEGLDSGFWLGPRRLMPVALVARNWPDLVHRALDAAMSQDPPAEDCTRFVIPHWQGDPPMGLDPREATIAARLASGPVRMADAVRTRVEAPALARLVSRGHVMVAGITPSDAAHVLGHVDAWDSQAAHKALSLFSRRRNGKGDRIGPDPLTVAQAIIDQLTAQTVDCLLEAAFAEDMADWGGIAPAALARYPVTRQGLNQHRGVVQISLTLGVPVIGLGASAPTYYRAVGERLGARTVLPEHAGVANAIGAVVGQVAMHATGAVTSPGPGRFTAHFPDGLKQFGDQSAAIDALVAALTEDATSRARNVGVEEVRLSVDRDLKEAGVEGQSMFLEARIRVTAHGRPRIALG
jgi:N-methylhydantoinase A/oxoprolinase/acetone carboxylase beta subunit